MGWNPSELGRPEFLLLSTHGGLRAEDGTPIALGYHTGHWEVGLLVAEAARELKRLKAIPFARRLHRPVRRAYARHSRNVRLSAVS